MDGLTKLEMQEKITAQVKNICEALENSIPEEWTKPQIASVFDLYLQLYR